MLTLYVVPGAGVVPSFSPPCAKLEGWLRLTGIACDVGLGDASSAPRQQLPYLVDDGRVVGDATRCLSYLRARHGVDPDAALTATERATALLARRAIKEHLYWSLVYARWVPDEGFAAYRAALASALPAALPEAVRVAAVDAYRPKALAQLHAQGLGRHALDAVVELAADDLAALATLLGDRPFFSGEAPGTLDVTAWATLTNILHVPGAEPLRAVVTALPHLAAHAERMGRRLFPERWS